MSVYSNLFRYRPQPQRPPLENFLSAALADLLNRLPRQEHERFVGEVILPATAREQWLEWRAGSPNGTLAWTTQVGVALGKGIVDLLLLADGLPAIVVENKVNASVRRHRNEDGADEQAPDGNQLRTYGRWLARACEGRQWPGALVLLTHGSPPPPDYDRGGYGVPIVGQCRWGQVWSWARRTGDPAAGAGARPMWLALAGELAIFLERNRMTADYMTLNDVAQAQVFVSAADRMRRTFEAIEERLDLVRRAIGKGAFCGIQYDASGAVVWDWFYLRQPDRANWYISWGLRFPELSGFWSDSQQPLPKVPHAFVSVGGENVPIPETAAKQLALPDYWTLAEGAELVVARPLHEFPPEPEALTGELRDWIAGQVEAIRRHLPGLAQSAN